MAELLCVDPARAHEVWPHISELIGQAVRKTDLARLQDIAISVLHGDGLIWLATEDNKILAAAVTSLSLTEASKVCTLEACAGKGMPDWIGLISRIEQYAKDEGCTAFRIYGRRGWLRALKDYRLKHVIIEKAL